MGIDEIALAHADERDLTKLSEYEAVGGYGALRKALQGARLTRFVSAGLRGAPVGERIEDVSARGKNLLIRFEKGRTLRTHLMLHGAWHIYREGEKWQRPAFLARVELHAVPELHLVYRDVLPTTLGAAAMGLLLAGLLLCAVCYAGAAIRGVPHASGHFVALLALLVCGAAAPYRAPLPAAAARLWWRRRPGRL